MIKDTRNYLRKFTQNFQIPVIIMLSLIVFCKSANAQNITNTLGNSGSFTIKDASNTFFSLNQNTGNLTLSRGISLPFTSGSTTGVIFKGTSRFIHDFAPPGAFGYNLFIGIDAGNFTMFGGGTNSSFNTSVGSLSLSALTTGANNSAFGYFTLYDNTTGANNCAFGTNSLSNNISGNNNSAFGVESLFNSQSVTSNSAFGYQSLRTNTSGSQNSSFGSQSLFSNNTGSSNCSFGFQSMYLNSFASNSSAFGYQSLLTNRGTGNNGFGYQSLYFNNGGVNNCAFGNLSLYNSVSGSNNTAIGNNTLYNNTGSFNSAIGVDAGSNVTSGSNLTLIGYNSQPTSGTASNQITLGNNSVTSLRCNVTTITSLSDARDKKNINDLPLGLSFISKLKPRLYNWDKREWYEGNVSDGSKMQVVPTAGFIAQELDEVQTSENAEWLNMVLKDNPEKWEATPGNLLPVMVKAIQELKEENDRLKSINNVMVSEIQSLKKLEEKFYKLEQLIKGTSDKKIEVVDTKNQ